MNENQDLQQALNYTLELLQGATGREINLSVQLARAKSEAAALKTQLDEANEKLAELTPEEAKD